MSHCPASSRNTLDPQSCHTLKIVGTWQNHCSAKQIHITSLLLLQLSAHIVDAGFKLVCG